MIVLNFASCYLSPSRIEGFDGDSLFPFDEDAIICVGEHSSYHPRQLINNLHTIIEKGAENDEIMRIDKEKALSLLEGQEGVPKQDMDIIDDFGDGLGFDE